MSGAYIAQRRDVFHKALILSGVYSIATDAKGEVPSNADSSSPSSRDIALRLARLLDVPKGPKLKGQTMGALFEGAIRDYIESTFVELQHIRPGAWSVDDLGNRGHHQAESYAQYEHLGGLNELAAKDSRLRIALGNDYVVSPDIIVSRGLLEDGDINAPREFIDDTCSMAADLRSGAGKKPILHASISAKWTIRSDRAQNSRTEALNLIRNRKGRLPHIVVATAEPLPSRIASLALGTGDIDCVYHLALYELREAVESYSVDKGVDDTLEMLDMLIAGRRLKDISDLPLDLCV